MNLPNFLIAGMPRCGTTVVHNVLSGHPDIYLSQGCPTRTNNEIWYWCKTECYEKGEHWYSQFFAGANGEKYIGEKTPWYMKEEAIKRIRADLGADVKFLMCVRDPILRPYSHWVHAQDHEYGKRHLGHRPGFACAPFGRCIRDRVMSWSFIEGSSYGKHVNNFVKFYPRENLYIMVNEELRADPYGEYGKLFDWLGLNPLLPNEFNPNKKINLSNYSKYGKFASEEDSFFLKESLKYDTERFYDFIGREIEAWK